MSTNPVGKTRNAAVVILLGIITFGIYLIVWYYKINNEIKLHDMIRINILVLVLLHVPFLFRLSTWYRITTLPTE